MSLLHKLIPQREPRRLTEDELDEDPVMGDPLDAGPESYQADPDDKDGLDDLPPEDVKY